MDVEGRQTESSSRKLMESPRPGPGTGTGTTGSRSRRKCICLSITAVLVSVGLLFLILGLTVFKPKRPTTSITSITLEELELGMDFAKLQVLLNVSLDVVISVHNPNRVGFRYHRGNAILRHRGRDVGEVPIPAGRIGSRDTRSLNLTVALMADRIASDSTLYTDVASGTVPFQAYIRLAGKVRLIFSIHVTTYSTCDLDIFLSNRTISHLNCHYRTKL